MLHPIAGLGPEAYRSFGPHAYRVYWKLIVVMFAFYVAVMAAATGVFLTHQSKKGSAERPSLADTIRAKHGGI